MISKLLAHANISETQGYSKILDLAVEKAMEIFNDKNNKFMLYFV